MKNNWTRRKEKALGTKQLLYTKALSLFSKKGYSDVTVDEICEKCNVSKGAFYNHFSSKHDIIIEQSKKSDSAQLDFFNSLHKDMPCSEKLRVFVKYIGEHIAQEKGYEVERIIYAAELSERNRPGYITDPNRPLYTCIKTIVKEGQDRGEFRKDLDLDEVLNVVICNVRGILYEWLITSGQKDLPNMALSVIDLLITGLKDTTTISKDKVR